MAVADTSKIMRIESFGYIPTDTGQNKRGLNAATTCCIAEFNIAFRPFRDIQKNNKAAASAAYNEQCFT